MNTQTTAASFVYRAGTYCTDCIRAVMTADAGSGYVPEGSMPMIAHAYTDEHCEACNARFGEKS